jgi:superfamily II DNA or RNA helicase
MEPASVMSDLPFLEDLRRGQRQIVESFQNETAIVAQLPTGYGKTRAAAAAYALLRSAGRANRVLYVVPRGAQAVQAADEVPALLLSATGVRTSAHIVGENPITAIKAHRKGTTEIFVVTVQSLVSSRATLSTVVDLMGTGRWFVIVDEHHHYGNAEDNVWTQRVRGLPSAALLAMSATPHRSDGTSIFGKPSVSVTYREALKEGAVKALSLHAYEYRIDAITVNGDVIPFDTKELFEAVGSESPQEIDKWMASRQMRWSPKYISPLVLYPVERAISLGAKGVRSQVLIQAMSCSHAKMVCDQVRALVPSSMSVDWVGTGPNGRSDQENDAALKAFCPAKDRAGRRNWSLSILVNVGIAGEGLDTTDVCEVVFLTSPSINNSSLQTIGRGSRRMYGVDPQPICTVNVDGASELAKFVGFQVMDVFDDELPIAKPRTPEDDEGPDPGAYDPLPEKLSVGILDVELVDIRTDPMFQDVLQHTVREVGSLAAEEEIERVVETRIRAYIRNRDETFNASALEAKTRDQVKLATRKVVGLLITDIQKKTGIRPAQTLVGDLMRRVNTEKRKVLGSVEEASVSELEKHYHWVKQLEAQIMSGREPSWLR